MPSPYSSPGSVADAEQLAQNLGIEFKVIPISDIFDQFLDILAPIFESQEPDITEQNIQARIRGNLLMALANRQGRLVLSTGNKSEMAVGYCTLYGDMSGGLAVISDVPKQLVYELCRYINRKHEIIPWNTIKKPPSAELAPGARAPNFSLDGSDGRTYTLAQFAGKQGVVLAWFPKAFTPG